MDSAQFSEWVAFLTYFPTPLGIATASIRQTIHNTMTSGRSVRARDFLPDRLKRAEEEAPAGHFTRMFKIIAKRFKGADGAGD